VVSTSQNVSVVLTKEAFANPYPGTFAIFSDELEDKWESPVNDQ
jgi:hypothetical protein